MVKHIVFTKFAHPDEDVPEAMKRLLALRETVPGILSMEAGRDILHSERSFDMALVVTFPDRAALEAYAVHPAHMQVKEFIHARRTGTATVDYEFEL